MVEQTTRCLESCEDKNEASRNKNKFLKNTSAEVGRPILLFLLGADAHHRGDNQRSLQAVYK
jgi:hypothetical protein